MQNKQFRIVSLVIAGAFALSLGACGDDGPAGPSGTDFDPLATDQALAGMQDRLDDDSDLLMSLELVGPALAAEGGVSMVLPRSLDEPVLPMAAGVARDFALAGAAAEPIFPSNLLGKTFTWSVDLGRYAVSELAGAPVDGVRFILYAFDLLTRRPVIPLVETGFLDLRDLSDASATRLGVHAESGGTALVDYVIEATYALLGEDVSVTLSAAGFISDGLVQLDFDLSQTATISTATETIAIDVRYELAVAGEDVAVALNLSGEFGLSGDGAPETATVELTIDHGTDHVVLTAELAADNSLSGLITYNGEPALLIAGTEADPVFTKVDGSELTAADVAALVDLFEMIGEIFDLAENLFEPFAG